MTLPFGPERSAREWPVGITMTVLVSLLGTPAQDSDEARDPWQAASQDVLEKIHLQRSELRSDLAPGGAAACGLLDATVRISPMESVKRHCTGWQGLLTESIYAAPGSRIELRFEAPVHLLVMYDKGARVEGETLIDGLAPSRLRNFSHKLTFVPAGHGYHEWHEISTTTRVTYLYLDPAKLQRPGDQDDTYAPRAFFEDSVVWETAAKLKSAIEAGEAGGIFYSEALAKVLAHELLRSGRGFVRSSPLRRGGLASWQIRAVTAYIEEHVGEQISLLTLARLARLSQHHLCRAFKQSCGIPPHQYHVQRRIARAKVLLADRANSVMQIALALGYSQPSAFSVAFRKNTGRTPKEFRRDFT